LQFIFTFSTKQTNISAHYQNSRETKVIKIFFQCFC